MDTTIKYHEMTELQKLAIAKYEKGENIFLTGPGGCGKSAIIKYIIKDAENKNIELQVCALTGCATVLLGNKSRTIHSWSGIGVDNRSIEEVSEKIATSAPKRKNWCRTSVLIVDEISMMSKKMIELLDLTGKKCRKRCLPFGGIQVIFSGDFFQLPPVGSVDRETEMFCFESPVFKKLFPKQNIIIFEKIFRQKDPLYSKILNQIRKGMISNNSIKVLTGCIKKEVNEEEIIKPTIIKPLKQDVDIINETSLKKIKGDTHVFKMEYVSPKNNKATKEAIMYEFKQIESKIYVEKELVLKVGAQVMCVVNMMDAEGKLLLCNGSQGVVIGFDVLLGYPIVQYRNGIKMTMSPHNWTSENIIDLQVKQVPLILSWAITIHKSQGASIEMAEIDAGSSIFAAGQTYVALSRVTSLEGLYLTNFDHNKIFVNQKVKEFYETLNKK